MIYIWDIEKIIEETLQKHRLKINFEFNNSLANPMNYNVSTNTIKFNYLQVNGFIAKTKVRIRETDENFIRILLYHEIGYYLDFRKSRHDLRIIMYGDQEEKEKLLAVIESNAWDYGRTIVPADLLKSYDEVRQLESTLFT